MGVNFLVSSFNSVARPLGWVASQIPKPIRLSFNGFTDQLKADGVTSLWIKPVIWIAGEINNPALSNLKALKKIGNDAKIATQVLDVPKNVSKVLKGLKSLSSPVKDGEKMREIVFQGKNKLERFKAGAFSEVETCVKRMSDVGEGVLSALALLKFAKANQFMASEGLLGRISSSCEGSIQRYIDLSVSTWKLYAESRVLKDLHAREVPVYWLEKVIVTLNMGAYSARLISLVLRNEKASQMGNFANNLKMASVFLPAMSKAIDAYLKKISSKE